MSCGSRFHAWSIRLRWVSVLRYLAIVVLAWATMAAVIGHDGMFAVEGRTNGNLFAIFVTAVVADLFGMVCEACGLPPLLGMLVAGLGLRNIPHLKLAADIDSDWSSVLRNIALTIILARAGLGMNIEALKRLRWPCAKLAALPNITEACTVAVVSHFLMDLPWVWSFLAGFIISAVSPAVVVPTLLKLQDEGYGVAKGIPTLVLAASSFDDVLSISGFGIALGLTFTESSLALNIARGPLEIIIGIAYGVFAGFIIVKWVQNSYAPRHPAPSAAVATTLPATEQVAGTSQPSSRSNSPTSEVDVDNIDEIDPECQSPDSAIEDMPPAGFAEEAVSGASSGAVTAVLLALGMIGVFAGKRIEFVGAGALAAIISGIIVRHYLSSSPATAVLPVEVGANLKLLWRYAQPVLFSLIGAAVNIDDVEGSFLVHGIVVILVGLAVRCPVTAAVASGGGINVKERLFIAIAWLPKATVQAAVGGIALDTAIERNAGAAEEERGVIVLTMAVLAILMTAPIGAILMSFSGRRLLDNSEQAGTDPRANSTVRELKALHPTDETPEERQAKEQGDL